MNTQDSNFRAINDDWPVFGFAKDFGNVSSSLAHGKVNPLIKIGSVLAREMDDGNTVVFTIGHAREPLVEYITINGIQNRTAYWKTKYKTVAAVVRIQISVFDLRIHPVLRSRIFCHPTQLL